MLRPVRKITCSSNDHDFGGDHNDDNDDYGDDNDDVNKESPPSQPAPLDKASTKISNRSGAAEFHRQPDVRSAPILSTFTQQRHKLLSF